MAKRVGVDKVLFCTTLVLVVIGLVMVFSASAIISQGASGSPYGFLIKQAIWGVLGLAAMTVIMQMDYRKLNNPRIIFPMVAVTALLLLVVFAMHSSHGAHRWIKLGAMSLQPSEMAKPVIVLFLAWFLQNKLHMVNDLRNTIIPAALPSLLFIALIMKEPDLGTALVCAGVTMFMLYLAGMNMKFLVMASAAAAPVLAYMLLFVKFRRDRLLAFLYPDRDPLGIGYHMNQSLIAVSTGGVFGRGYMEGVQKLYYLAGVAHRLHLRQYLRGIGLGWCGGSRRFICRTRLSRTARGVADPRSVCALPGLRHYDEHSDSGFLQYQRGAGASADEGNYAAVYLLWRNFFIHHPSLDWRTAEHYTRVRLRVVGLVSIRETGGPSTSASLGSVSSRDGKSMAFLAGYMAE